MTILSRGLEQGAAITGAGMSPIGRRTGVAGIELTTAAGRAAIADAGLRPSDIDGITSMGDTPIDAAARPWASTPPGAAAGSTPGACSRP